MAEADRTVSGVVDRAAAALNGINRKTLAWAGVALAAVTLLSVNLIASSALRGAKVDLTEERLFTISDGTRKALRAIDEPVDVTVYFSKKLGELAPNYGKSFERVRTMLDRYSDISRGKLRVTYLDPEPFSDAEERAVAAGLKGIRLNQEGEMGYFGIAGTNTIDTQANLPFLALDRERFLEYDVTKLIVTLASPHKTAVGLISSIPMEGSPGNPMLGQPPSQGPLLIDQIKEFFEIKSIAKDAKEIPSDIGVLMVVQPEHLSPETAYAIDQFALAGGKVLAFVDPVAETTRQGNQMMMMMQGPPDLGEFNKLLKSWGVAFDTTKVAADLDRARRVQFGSGANVSVASYVPWLALKEDSLDRSDVLTGNVTALNFASAGILEKAAGATTKFSPVVHTTAGSMRIPAESISMMPDPKALLRNYKPGGTPLTIAARVSGEAKSAFPDGAPKPPAAKDAKSDGKAGADKPAADKAATDKKGSADAKAPAPKLDAKVDGKAGTGTAAPSRPHIASGKINVVVVADTDFLQDQFWLDVREMLGQQVVVPNAHNGTFVLAALENLTGSDALISLRARGVDNRPFELVNQLQREAEERYLASEQALTGRLNELRTKLANLQKEGSGELVLTDKDQKEIEKFRADLIKTQHELRLVKRELRKDIDHLDGVLKFFNIAAVPLLIGLVSIGLAYRRRRPSGDGNGLAQGAEEHSHDA
ncbi:MAG TPA: Gldg family protein [Hyphomicrobiaceae bacterium]|nr:Gldg family protein [Hyphomicrobiaceae bacterium]